MTEKQEMESLDGSVESVIFSSEETGYTVFDFGTDKNELITAVGILPYLAEGDELTIWGTWTHNQKYGRQFRVEQFEKRLPSNAAAILRYLSSGAIKGIGPKTAKKIVDRFGEETFDVLENHPEWLSDLPGITRKAALKYAEEFAKQENARAGMMFFRNWFGAALTVRICNTWGQNAVRIARSNPYALCEIEGVGFEKADAVAADIGFDRNGIERIKSGLLYTLRYNAIDHGHTCLPEEMLIGAAATLLNTSKENVKQAKSALLADQLIRQIRTRTQEGETLLVFDRRYYEEERRVAARLIEIDRGAIPLSIEDIRSFIAKEERAGGIAYAERQKQAIAAALESGVMILTGGPGTGKTTVVRALMHIFSSMGLDVALAAPTGRAAKRLSESTSNEAKTVHRLLEMGYAEGGEATFSRNAQDRLSEDVIIVDETSMLDISLTAALVAAIKPGARLILIGDADQLPSVGAGNVLRDLIRSERFATIELNEIFRQAQNSLIVRNAHAINHGKLPILTVKDNDFFYVKRENEYDIAPTIADLCANRLPRTYGGEIARDIQVLSPSRKGVSGTEHLNVLLQEALNPPSPNKREYKVREMIFREGDRVMQTRNNYEMPWEKNGKDGMGVFNGDIGRIEQINTAEKSVTVLFEDRRATYDFGTLDELELAYAVTVHKSQGSEYPVVILPLFDAPSMLLARNLFYTAVTRAQKMFILVGKESVVERMVQNNRISKRFTGLTARLFAGGAGNEDR